MAKWICHCCWDFDIALKIGTATFGFFLYQGGKFFWSHARSILYNLTLQFSCQRQARWQTTLCAQVVGLVLIKIFISFNICKVCFKHPSGLNVYRLTLLMLFPQIGDARDAYSGSFRVFLGLTIAFKSTLLVIHMPLSFCFTYKTEWLQKTYSKNNDSLLQSPYKNLDIVFHTISN